MTDVANWTVETPEAQKRTRISGDWVVGYNGDSHVIYEGGTVVISGDTIEYVGLDYRGPEVDVDIRFPGRLISPGLISTHLHADMNAADYAFLDQGRVDAWGRNYLNWQAGRRGETRLPGDRLSMAFGLAQCLRSGVTTVVEIGCGAGSPAEFARVVEELGVRVYSGPSFRDIVMFSAEDGRLEYDHQSGRGRQGLARAVQFIEKYDGAAAGRLKGILCPGHTDTCDLDLLRETASVAAQMTVPVTIHGAINIHETVHAYGQHGCSPVELLARVGLLSERVILGHGLFISSHSALPGGRGDDLRILGQSGATVSHSPYKYFHMGYLLESAQRYLDAGVNLTIGTDFSPSDILSEMRLGMLGSRVADQTFLSGTPRDIYNAATLNASKALGRNDLGRLSPGAKADITIVNLSQLRFGAVRDPIKTLVEQASGSDVDTVFVDGVPILRGGQLVRMDDQELLTEVRAKAEEAWAAVPSWSWGGRKIDDMVTRSFKHVERSGS